uniref:Uncharacterized protein n=1 Tax=Roseihalotalea indica TaxID=2867963 RepID=A0AA49GMA4_9BACT|nr:hypothetical protein K4G66_01890 [Tunicatimonas sp. TK19036]
MSRSKNKASASLVAQSQENSNILLKNRKKYSEKKKILFSIIWLYIVTRILVTDIDALIIYNLGLSDISLYAILRLLVITLVVVITWIKISNIKFWQNMALLAVFPLYPGFYTVAKKIFQVPKYLYQNRKTTLLFYSLEVIVTFFVNFKSNVAKIILLLLGMIGLFYFDNYWLFIPICTFSIIQLSHLWKRFKQSFSPIKFFGLKMDFENDQPKGFSAEEALKSIKEEANEKLNEDEKEAKEMEHFLMLSVFSNALGARMRYILNNKTYMISLLGKVVFSFTLSIICFGGINYALYSIDPSWFRVDFNPSYFDFIYYSFFTIFSEGVDIEPVVTLTKIVRMAGVGVSFLINFIILVVLFNNNNEKYQKSISHIMHFSQGYNSDLDNYFQDKYGYSPKEKLTTLDSKSKIKDAITFINHVLTPPR